jgi:hypothetical protein
MLPWFQIIRAMTTKIMDVWVITPCALIRCLSYFSNLKIGEASPSETFVNNRITRCYTPNNGTGHMLCLTTQFIKFRANIWAELPITVAARSKTWTDFARSDVGIVRSNPTQIHWCLCGFILCVCSGLATGWSTVQEVLPTVYNSGVLVRQRTIPTKLPPLVGEVSANFSG